MVVLLVAASFFAVVKTIFFGLQIDEQYAISMAYRIASGTRMFTGLYDPHQLSAFPCVLLIKIFMTLTGGVTGLVVFLRAAGFLMQLLVFLFTYNTFKLKFSKVNACLSSLAVIILLPKYIQTVEFSNLFLWSVLCAVLCFLRLSWTGFEKQKAFLVLGAMFYCLAVLSYPSALILFPVFSYALVKEGKSFKPFWTFALTCVICGGLYISYFLLHMSPSELLEGIRNMMADGSHSASALEKIAGYARELGVLLLHGIFIVIPAFLGVFLAGKAGKTEADDKEALKRKIVSLIIIFASADQLIMWLFGSGYINMPLALYYAIALAGYVILKDDKTLIRLCFIPSLFSVLSVLILTNTTIGFSGAFLLPAFIAIFAMLLENNKDILARVAIFAFLFVLLFAKGFLVCLTEGRQGNVLIERQKILSGPGKGIYDEYLCGFETNEFADIIDEYVTEDDSVLYVGGQTVRCLMMKGRIANPSTISTPTYDPAVLNGYWEKNKALRPTVVVIERDAKAYALPGELIDGEILYHSSAYTIYRLKGTGY